MRTVAIVIPFFQRERGILLRCLSSVEAQSLPNDVNLVVFVVDDGSPISAKSELECRRSYSNIRISVLERPNGGPAAARNSALDAICNGIDFVAFIDSDDTWHPDHLIEALRVLEESADFYFCDSELESHSTEFERMPIINESIVGGFFIPCAGLEKAFTIPNEVAADLIVRNYVAHTSTVVYRFSAMPDLRFDETLRYGAEDHLMWVKAVCQAREVRFSTAVFSVRGEGINMYRDALDRVSGKNIRREACRVQAFNLMSKLPNISEQAKHAAREKHDETLREILSIILRPAGLKAARSPDAQPHVQILIRNNWKKFLRASIGLAALR